MNACIPAWEQAVKPLIGQWVCAVKKDGTYAIGRVERVRNGKLALRGFPGRGKVSSADPKTARAQIAAMGGGGLGSMFGSGFPFGGGMGNMGGMGSLGNFGSGLGGLGRGLGLGSGFAGRGLGMGGNVGSLFSLGFGALKFLLPLMSFFF